MFRYWNRRLSTAVLVKVRRDMLITLQPLIDLCICHITPCLSTSSRHSPRIRARELALGSGAGWVNYSKRPAVTRKTRDNLAVGHSSLCDH